MDRHIGQGFDDARLDTLFLAMPVSWKGTLVQYSERLHRLHPRKTEAEAAAQNSLGTNSLLPSGLAGDHGVQQVAFRRQTVSVAAPSRSAVLLSYRLTALPPACPKVIAFSMNDLTA